MSRFHTPLIELGVRISRTQLSEEASRCRTRSGCSPQLEPDQAKLRVQEFVGEPSRAPSLYLSSAGASFAEPCPVSTPRLSNWACGFPAPSSRRKHHGVAHGRVAVRNLSRTKPNCEYRSSSENRRVPRPCTLCLVRSHCRSRRTVCRSTAR